MRQAIATAIPMLLVSACAAGDVSLKTRINSYVVPDEMTRARPLSAEDILEDLNWKLETIEFDLDIARRIANSSGFRRGYRQEKKLEITDLEAISNDINEALDYTNSATYDGKFGILSFTYIRSDLNNIKSSEEKTLICAKKPKTSTEGKILWMKYLEARWEWRSHIENTIADTSREQEDLAELSKKLCKRYFSFDQGGFHLSGQPPRVFGF